MGRDCRICQLSSHPYKEMTQLTTEPASTSLKQHVLVGVLSVAHRRRNPALGLVGGNRQRCAHTSVVEQTHLRCMLCSSTCMALSFDQHSWSISPLLFFFFFGIHRASTFGRSDFFQQPRTVAGRNQTKNLRDDRAWTCTAKSPRVSSVAGRGHLRRNVRRRSTVQYSTVFYKAK